MKDLKENLKKLLKLIFIDGLSGMALGLFATLIVGTILAQIATVGALDETLVGKLLTAVASLAKTLMGVGIGVGIAYKFKSSPLVTVAAGVAGFIGAFASDLLSLAEGNITSLASISQGKPGDPLTAFVAAMVAIGVGYLVSGKTKVDILVTPIVTVLSGSVAGLLFGRPIASVTGAISSFVGWSTERQPFLMGILVAVVMGLALTLPTSSAAIGEQIHNKGMSSAQK